MTKIYRYVLMSDGGMAPNPRGTMLSLATCKPALRSTASIGDWVVANRSSPHNQLVVWAGQIYRVVSPGEYSSHFPQREDALYRSARNGELERIPRLRTWYHQDQDQQRRDMRGYVLLFDWDCCWYFGDDPRPYPEALAHLAATGQGHRTNGVGVDDANLLEQWLMSTSRPGRIGNPRDGWEGQESKPCGPAPSGCQPIATARSKKTGC